MQDNYTITPLDENDVLAVCKIESSLLGKTSEEKIMSTIESSTLFYYVLKLKNKVIGFYECSIISPEAELFDIAISKDFQGKGYSKLLMQNLIDICKNCGCNTIFLEVNNMNNVAIKLYEKFGFKSYSIRKNYYGDNDAILMKCEI